MPGPASTSGKSIKGHKLGHTAGRDYGANTSAKKNQSPRDLSAKK